MFGAMVREHRRRLGLTQEELAGDTGISVRSIGKIESGQITAPRPATVRLLADAFGLTGDDLVRFRKAAAKAAPSDVTQQPSHASGPAQLPPAVSSFTGRDEELAQLDALMGESTDLGCGPTRIAVVSGMAGVGKTALAVYWAQRLSHLFPDGQLYTNLRGFDPGGPAASPAEAVRNFLDALGVAPGRVPADPAAQVGMYRSLLARRRMLVVLDNAGDAAQVRPLLPGAPGCAVVVTSRDQLTGLVASEGAHPLVLDLLPVGAARELLARRLGPDRVAAESEAVAEIVELCARLPLALAITAARAAADPRLSLTKLADELRDAGARLDLLETGDPATDVRTVFSWSYERLNPGAARLFRLMGRYLGPDISAAAIASLAGQPAGATARLLGELTRAHLVTRHADRYSLHDLLGAYAIELGQSLDPPQDTDAADVRLLDHYLHTAHAGALLLDPHRDRIALTPRSAAVTPEPLADAREAQHWFLLERSALLAAVQRADEAGFDRHTWQLAWTLVSFLEREGHWDSWATTQERAIDAAGRLADRHGQAMALRQLGRAYAKLGRHDDAHAQLQQAVRLFEEVADDKGQALTHRDIASLFGYRGKHAQALEHAELALALYRTRGDRVGQAGSLNAVGWYHAVLGHYARALSHCQQAAAMLQEIGDPQSEADTWDSIGYAYHHLGDHGHAIASYQHSIELWRQVGHRYGEADTLSHLAESHLAGSDPQAARAAWQQALEILTDLGHPDADSVRARLRDLEPLVNLA